MVATKKNLVAEKFPWSFEYTYMCRNSQAKGQLANDNANCQQTTKQDWELSTCVPSGRSIIMCMIDNPEIQTTFCETSQNK